MKAASKDHGNPRQTIAEGLRAGIFCLLTSTGIGSDTFLHFPLVPRSIQSSVLDSDFFSYNGPTTEHWRNFRPSRWAGCSYSRSDMRLLYRSDTFPPTSIYFFPECNDIVVLLKYEDHGASSTQVEFVYFTTTDPLRHEAWRYLAALPFSEFDLNIEIKARYGIPTIFVNGQERWSANEDRR